MMFYFCVGKMPTNLVQETVKKNSSFDFVVILTIVSHVIIGLKFWMFNKRENVAQGQPKRAFAFEKLKEVSIYRFVPQLIV